MSRALRRQLRQLPYLLPPLLLMGGGLWWYFHGLIATPIAPTEAKTDVKTSHEPPKSNPQMVGIGAKTFVKDAPPATEVAAPSAPCPECDIVVITVCSLRRDYVSAYGIHPDLSPNMDSISQNGWRFDNAWSASNFTLASLTAILTGRFGSSTGVLTWDKGLTQDVPTLPEVLGYYGYRTGAFTIDAPSGFRPDYGLDRGFQHMEIMQPPRDTPDGRSASGSPGPGGASARPVADWIAAQPKDRPIFAMYHNRSAHFPFVLSAKDADQDPTGLTQALFDAGRGQRQSGPMPGTAGGTAHKGVVSLGGQDPLQGIMDQGGEAALAMWRQRYAEAVARTDIDIGVVLEAIKARGRPTVLLLVADHGESLNDHSELLHGDAYWDGVVHVPLLLQIPGLNGTGHIPALVSHVDLAPTLLEAVGAMPPSGIDGHSLLPLLRGSTQSLREIALVEGGVRYIEGSPRGAVVAPPYILIRQDRGCGPGPQAMPAPGEPATCLYDLVKDPGEEHNIALDNPQIVADLYDRWTRFRAARSQEGAQLKLSPEAIDALQRTGYDFRPEADPK